MDFTALMQAGDCEAIHDAWLIQPINAWSSLAFSLIGAGIAVSARWVAGRERVTRIVFGILLIATGVGSFLFHGPQPSAAHFVHDMMFLASLWFLIVANLTGAYGIADRLTAIIVVVGVTVLAVLLLVAPDITNLVMVILAIGLVAADLVLWRIGRPSLRWYGIAIGSLVVGLALFLVGRTDSPLCDADGLLQAHAGWHVFAAVFLGSYLVATTPARTGGTPA